MAFTPADLETELRRLLPGDVRLVPQEGADLGARLDRILTDLLLESGAGAIAIDTDSPTVPTDYLRQACTHLARGARPTSCWDRARTAATT